jgi:hypothetical protein
MKAALLEVASGMLRFYPGRPGVAGSLTAGLAALMLVSGRANAQTPAPSPAPPPIEKRPPLGATFTVDTLGVLPVTGSVFSVTDTVVPDTIVERIEPGASNPGSAARVGAHGSTWTQTTFRVGDVDITNPIGNGAPLLIPGVESWDSIEVATGLMPIDVSAPGMAVTLMPRRPASSDWTRSIQFIGSPPAFNAGSSTASPPAISRVNSWANADLFLSGPLVTEKVGALLSATWTRSTRFDRSDPATLNSSLASVFFNLVNTPTKVDEIRTVGWVQRARDASANGLVYGQSDAAQHNSGLHLQSAWQRVLGNGDTGVRLFGSYTIGRRSTDLLSPGSLVADSVTGVPIPDLLNPGVGGDHTWTFGGRINKSLTTGGGTTNDVMVGLDYTGASSSNQSIPPSRVGELVNGIPARVWDFTDPVAISEWRSSNISFFANDTVALLPSLTINAGFRFEGINGSAEGGATPISWRNVMPRAGFHWAMLDFWHLAAFGQYGQYAHRLPLAALAYGDPAAPTAAVYRWTATTAGLPQPDTIGPLVERWGPGTGGDPTFSAIDPGLKRPVMHEAVLGFEAHPRPSAFVRLSAIGRRETNIMGVVNVGVPFSSYTTVAVPDQGVDTVGAGDDQTLIFYNRSPATFGGDRYLLTNPANPAGDESTFVGAELVGQLRHHNFFVMAGITAGRSEEIAGNRGFGPLENDEGVLGDVYSNPNSGTNPEGRVFTERGYTIKTALTYLFSHDWSLSAIGRYQDGQHFARIVIEPDLNQGADFARAFRNGRTRFTFSMTVDARLQKTFTIADRKLTAMIDAYNLFNQSLEVEEDSVTGPSSRLTTAVQPPRVLMLGVRVPF